MSYQHEFTIDAADITAVPQLQSSTLVLSFELEDPADGPQNNDIVTIDGRDIRITEVAMMENFEGYDAFWEAVDEACDNAMRELLADWAEEYAEGMAEMRASARGSRFSRMADMGMDVPAR